MAKTDKAPETEHPSLAEAAMALDAALERFAERGLAARKIKMTSEKNIARAARAAEEAAKMEEEIAASLAALVRAIAGAQKRQQATIDAILEHAQEIRRRSEQYKATLERLGALSVEAKAITVSLQSLAADPSTGRMGSELEAIDARMRSVFATADEIAKSAEADEMQDIAREADSLRQQTDAARKKLSILRTS